MKVDITKKQLEAIMDMADNISAMTGCGDDDSEWIRLLSLVDRFLKKNGRERQYK